MSKLRRSPVVGFNHNIIHLGWEFHLQTEDSGVQSPHIITHLFHHGAILATKKLVYDGSSAAEFVKDLMQAQHKAVLRELKAGIHDAHIGKLLGAATQGAKGPKEPESLPAVAETPPPPAAPSSAAAAAAPPRDAGVVAPAQAAKALEAATSTVPTLVNHATLEWASLLPSPVPVPRAKDSSGGRAPSQETGAPPAQPWVPTVPQRGSLPAAPPSFTHSHEGGAPGQQPASWRFQQAKTPLPFGSPVTSSSTYFSTKKIQERLMGPAPDLIPESQGPRTAKAGAGSRTHQTPQLDVKGGRPMSGLTTAVVHFPHVKAFLDAYFEGGDCGGILVQGNVEAQLGTLMLVLLRFEDGGGGQARVVELRARVAWRRRKGSGRLQPGTGVEFSAGERDTVLALLDQARGAQRSPAERAHARQGMSHTVKILHGIKARKETASDLSEGGVFVKTGDLIPVGEEVMVTLKAPKALRGVDVRGRVAWHKAGAEPGMGVTFLFDEPAHQERVENLVAQLIAQGL